MRKVAAILFLILPFCTYAQEAKKRVLFRSDSTWYAGQNQMLFSSTDKGASWNTIFANKNQTDTAFFYGALDTATNVFISDQRTLFVFGWDGTMHHKTVLFSSIDGGKTWNKATFNNYSGPVGVKYIYKTSPGNYFIYLRQGKYAYTTDSGKTWTNQVVYGNKYGCFDDHVVMKVGGEMTVGFSPSGVQEKNPDAFPRRRKNLEPYGQTNRLAH